MNKTSVVHKAFVIRMLCALGLALGIWTMSFLGFFSLPKNLFYDLMTRWSIPLSSHTPQILLITTTASRQQTSGEPWRQLLATLETHKARQVVFTFMPHDASSRFYQEAEQHDNVVFGRTRQVDPDNPDAMVLADLPAAATSRQLRIGVTDVPPSQYGVHRYQSAAFEAAGTSYPALAVQAAGLSSDEIPPGAYLVTMRTALDRLPTVTMDRVLSGGLPAELVQGRVVLVGMASEDNGLGFHTPLTPHHEMMSPLVWQGLALDTLLAGKRVTPLPPLITLGLLLVLALGGFVLYQRLGVRPLSWTTGGLLLTSVAVAWALFFYAFLWVPLLEIVLTQGLVCLLVQGDKNVVRENALRRMLLQTSEKLQERFFPASVYSAEDFWEHILTLAEQTLPMDRAVFLEARPHAFHVYEAYTWNCTIADLQERRRDYNRAPYSTALSANGPVQLEERQFFEPPAHEEIQYLIPLTIAGEVLGFWVLGVETAQATAIAQYETFLSEVGKQVAILLRHRQQWQGRNQIANRPGEQEDWQLQDDKAYHELKRAFTLLERRLVSLETIFETLATAMSVYDLFGRALHVNGKMIEILQAKGLAPYVMTAFDIIHDLCGLDTVQAHRIMQHVVFERNTLTLPAALVREERGGAVLRISPILNTQHGDESPDVEEMHPFQISGVLLELLDVSDLQKIYKLKEQLIERMYFQLRSDLEPVLLATSLLERKGLDETKRQRVMDIIRKKVSSIVGFLAEAQQHLGTDVSEKRVESYPVDAKEPLKAVVQELEGLAKSRHITFHSHLPDLMSLAYAAPDALKEVLQATLYVILQDAAEDSTVEITMEEKDHAITYTMSNQGFGMPDERFQAYLFGDDTVTSDEFRKLREAIRTVQSWGGTVNATSAVGVGIHLTLCLKGFA